MIIKAPELRQTEPPKNNKADDFTANKEREQQQELRRLIAIQARGQSDRL